jgi:hypothetical protein
MDLIDWIRCARLWWLELWAGRMMKLGISHNKAIFPIFWRLVVLMLFRGIR